MWGIRLRKLLIWLKLLRWRNAVVAHLFLTGTSVLQKDNTALQTTKVAEKNKNTGQRWSPLFIARWSPHRNQYHHLRIHIWMVPISLLTRGYTAIVGVFKMQEYFEKCWQQLMMFSAFRIIFLRRRRWRYIPCAGLLHIPLWNALLFVTPLIFFIEILSVCRGNTPLLFDVFLFLFN